ncbi:MULTISPECIES: molecular chaperone HscC [Kordiimonas]|jgi:molecular chaperone HscC|uniref:molecular chaperone HscC n=1 Tax=Kordiimonas TaxID=288021 RepID=UPI00257D05C6|nr:molecular chaperone HscC [Kordiimonas sp. UBA4487]
MTIIGIDLGTTNSACGYWQDGEIRLIPNRSGDYLTPSVVGLDGNNNVIVGKVARNRLITHPDNTVGVFKRLMGTNHQVSLGKRRFTATELSAFVLKALKEDAEAHLGEEVTEAIISVPAYFNDNQRHATKQAGEIAGLTVRRLINEPTAAALAYGLHERAEGMFVVLDMGGGTFDVSILEYFDGIMEVHASAGDNFLGGEDFLEAMVVSFCKAVDVDKDKLGKSELQQLYDRLEQIKRKIHTQDSMLLEMELRGKQVQFEATPEWFKECTLPQLMRVRHPIEQALRDANLRVADVTEVLLVGGATRMPVFRNMVGTLFKRIPAGHLDPDLVVAMGAAVQAGLKARDKTLDDVVLTDVCPYTLGTEVVDPSGSGKPGFFLPLIERNSVVPTSHVETLMTVSKNQQRMEVNVFQGEHRLVEQNVFLGSVSVAVPKGAAGEQTIDVRYSYDMNGLLEVDVKVNSTGQVINHVIEQSPGALSQEEVEKSRARLAGLKFHPREKEENLVLISRAEKLYLTSLGEMRTLVGRYLSEFESVLDTQKETEIAKARDRFSEVLDQLDPGSIL